MTLLAVSVEDTLRTDCMALTTETSIGHALLRKYLVLGIVCQHACYTIACRQTGRDAIQHRRQLLSVLLLAA